MTFMDNLLVLGACAIITQFVVEQLRNTIPPKHKDKLTPIISLLIGISIALVTQRGILQSFDIPVINSTFDYIITGIIYSGGTIAFNELLQAIAENKNKKE